MKPNLPPTLCPLLATECGWRDTPSCADGLTSTITISNIPWPCPVIPYFPTQVLPRSPGEHSLCLLLKLPNLLPIAHSQLITLLSFFCEKTVAVRRGIPHANPLDLLTYLHLSLLPAFLLSLSGLFAKASPSPSPGCLDAITSHFL